MSKKHPYDPHERAKSYELIESKMHLYELLMQKMTQIIQARFGEYVSVQQLRGVMEEHARAKGLTLEEHLDQLWAKHSSPNRN